MTNFDPLLASAALLATAAAAIGLQHGVASLSRELGTLKGNTDDLRQIVLALQLSNSRFADIFANTRSSDRATLDNPLIDPSAS